MIADPEGRGILRARPVINEATVDLRALAVSVQFITTVKCFLGRNVRDRTHKAGEGGDFAIVQARPRCASTILRSSSNVVRVCESVLCRSAQLVGTLTWQVHHSLFLGTLTDQPYILFRRKLCRSTDSQTVCRATGAYYCLYRPCHTRGTGNCCRNPEDLGRSSTSRAMTCIVLYYSVATTPTPSFSCACCSSPTRYSLTLPVLDGSKAPKYLNL